MGAMPMPIEIVGLGQDRVRFVWDEGHEGSYPARELRLACRCAHCVDEMTGAPVLDPETVPADVRVTTMDLVGNYGVQIRFSDGHATGIYRFADLMARCPCSACRTPQV
jgi:ATP-binding protein involved in chromosome partitioning